MRKKGGDTNSSWSLLNSHFQYRSGTRPWEYWVTQEKRTMESLREFFTSSSGLVPARQGLGLGWVISALTGITVLLGAKEAEADNDCGVSPWIRDLGYSAACDEATNGARSYRCQRCQRCQDCHISPDCESVVCGAPYCCA